MKLFTMLYQITNKFMYKLNVHLLNESLSEQLFLDANNFEEWNIYNSTFDSFFSKVEKIL